jgi:transposase
LSQKELQRVTVTSQCVRGTLTCARAAELLALSPRHVKQLKSRYRQGSAAALAHVSRGRASPSPSPERARSRILALVRTRYTGFNDHHLQEKLVEKEGFSLSRETLRRLLRANGIGSPRKRRSPAHRQRRLRSAREGELVQLDGSPHHWLEGRGPLLTALGMQDDSSGKILAAQFFPSETRPTLSPPAAKPLAPLRRSRPLLRRPQRRLHPQHRSTAEQLAGRRQPTQFGRALERLGVTFIAAQSPQAKGRIERLWGLLQDRLTSELRLTQACDLEAAHRVLAHFVADYNRRLARTPRDAAEAWRPSPHNLERICCFTHERIVSNDNVVQWNGRRLQIHPQPRRFSFAGAKVQIYQALNGRVSLYYRDTRLEHSILSRVDIFTLPLG